MLYAAMTFWLMLILLSALGVQRLWAQIVQPKVMNIVLLPGTLVAQLGHVLGLLVTGATVSNTALYQNESGDPGTTRDAKPRIPVVGPMVIGLLPLLACAGAILAVARFFGSQAPDGLWDARLPAALPTTLAGVWEMLREQLTMMERLVDVGLRAFPGNWRMWLFVYLMICLTVRMAPFPGNFRGSLGAILLLGLLGAVTGMISGATETCIHASWPVLTLTVSTLLLLLTGSALIRGVVGLSRMIAHNE